MYIQWSSIIFLFQALSKNRQLTIFFLIYVQKRFPILFRMVEKAVEIHIIHKCNPHHGCKTGEAPGTSQSLFHYHKQQVGYKCHLNLYFDSICTFPIKIFQGEVLFYLLEQQFYLPTFAVDFYNLVRIRFHIVCKQ